ncbi:plasmid stabilization protein [Burkholderia pseudomultivorans]|uniref:plasmid stabilization protein n=1 Tax=Burkholderia pseudomultivorans TaxID=1207504 RepID=UPI0028757E20|nr:plasmid stabilization protein [Burkholderia pseudomultivorans]MDS0862212.1 plasmid stabilization protein [Burkholderia pseudomultivorans]
MVVRERLCVELGVIRLRWDDWCARRGLTAGEGARQLIVAAIGDDCGEPPVAYGTRLASPVVGEPRARVEIRLTAAELAAVGQRATASGLSGNRWIVSVVRAQLTREPQFGEHEMRALSESSQQLAGINRLLGQLVRARGLGPAESERMPDWADMRDQIDAHLRATSAVIRANLDRWSR